MNKNLLLLFSNIKGIGPKKLCFLYSKIKEKYLNHNLINDNNLLLDILKESNLELRKDLTIDDINEAQNKSENIIELCEKYNIKIIGIEDNEYPKQLKDLDEAPFVIYCKGNINIVNTNNCIAVIGTRNPTSIGTKAAERLGNILAQNNIVVVSGLALGCDTGAHTGCVKEKGKTVAVMAEGLDKIYPAKNKKLAQEILENDGCLFSEYPPETKAFKGNFVARDRLQSGISQGVIVVETDIIGGTMHTVKFALKQKRLLGAFQHDNKYSTFKQTHGNTHLISEHLALPIRNGYDIYEFIEKIKNKFYINSKGNISIPNSKTKQLEFTF